MKKTLIFICLLAAQLQAQVHELDTIAGVQAALSGPHPNLFEAQRIIEDWKAARPNAFIGKTQKHWNRFYNFWKHRVTATGDPAPYFKNSKQHLKTQEETVGNILSLAVDGQILYAGTQSRGLFKSIDAGKNWVNLTDIIGIPDLGISDIDVDPKDPKHIIISCISFSAGYFKFNLGDRIFQSFDAGQTWNEMNFPKINTNQVTFANHRNKSILINPHNNHEYFLTNLNQIYRSKNKGKNWHLLYEDSLNREMRDLLILESDPKTLFFLGVGKQGKFMYLSIPNDNQIVKNISEYINPFRFGYLLGDKFEKNQINLFLCSGLDHNMYKLFWDGQKLQNIRLGIVETGFNFDPKNFIFEQSSTNPQEYYVGRMFFELHSNLRKTIFSSSMENSNIAISININGKEKIIYGTENGIYIVDLQCHVKNFDPNLVKSQFISIQDLTK